MKPLSDFIVEIPNIADSIFLDAVMTTISEEQWGKGLVGDNALDSKIRNCDHLLLNQTLLNELAGNYVVKAFNEYTKIFTDLTVSKDTGYELLRYKEGGYYTTHVDSFYLHPRTLTISISLNDDFEGGEWSFFDGEYIIKPKALSAIVFPSNFMFPHGILPITKGVRYSLISWCV